MVSGAGRGSVRLCLDVAGGRRLVTVEPVDGDGSHFRLSWDDTSYEVHVSRLRPDALSVVVTSAGHASHEVTGYETAPGELALVVGGRHIRARVTDGRHRRKAQTARDGGDHAVAAPMPGRVVRVQVAPGDVVQGGSRARSGRSDEDGERGRVTSRRCRECGARRRGRCRRVRCRAGRCERECGDRRVARVEGYGRGNVRYAGADGRHGHGPGRSAPLDAWCGAALRPLGSRNRGRGRRGRDSGDRHHRPGSGRSRQGGGGGVELPGSRGLDRADRHPPRPRAVSGRGSRHCRSQPGGPPVLELRAD